MLTAEDAIEDILVWIDNNLDKQININEVASRAGYSKWHFQRVFVRVMDISLAKYIRVKKLKLAARDLSDTNDAIIHILLRYGFDSQQTFTRIFSQQYKISPARYRLMKWPCRKPIPPGTAEQSYTCSRPDRSGPLFGHARQ